LALVLSSTVSITPRSSTSDWPQFQYDAQHTGYNPHANVQPPLELKFQKRIGATQLKPVSVYEGLAMSIVYVLPGPGGDTIYCYNAKTGEDVWIDYILPFSAGTAQAVAGYGMWFVQANRETDGWVSAHDLRTGELQWVNTYRTQAGQCLSPVLYDSVLLHESGTYGGIEAINVMTGETQWWQKWYQIEAWSPSIFRDSVYGYLKHHLAVTAVHNPDSGVNIAYTLLDAPCRPEDYPPEDKALSYVALTAVVFDTLRAIALLTEQEAMWAFDMDTRTYLWKKCAYFAQDYHWRALPNPAIKDGRVYMTESGALAVYDLMTGEEIWRFSDTGEFCYPPVLTNDYVFVSGQFNTYMVDLSTHQKVWSFPAGGYLSVANDMLYIGGYLGTVYAFGPVPTDASDDPKEPLPSDYVLEQNYPNPFNPSTTIAFALPEQSHVRLSIYNVLGREVAVLVDGSLPAGSYSRVWDGTAHGGDRVSSGLYFYRLTTDEVELSKKMLLLK
jgi:outer membrane protein assembly factor BamB